jgi:large subunit ribosomal protein L4
MAKIDVMTSAGTKSGTAELDDAVFGIEPNTAVMHQVVTAQLAAKRAGTQSTLTRAEVRGGGAKPWKQKGTGRARAGSSNSPNWRGGGVAMGPKPRDYSQRTPKKMKRLALRSALSDRAAEGNVMVVDGWSFEAPKTRDAVAALNAIGAEGKILLVVDAGDEATWKSFRNLANVHVLSPGELNVYDILNADKVVFTKDNLPTAPVAEAKASPAASSDDSAAADNDAEAISVMDDPTADSDADGEVNPDDDTPFGAGSAHPVDGGDAPSDTYTIKGNADSMLYHPPESPFYSRTVAEVWFTDAATAEAAGFSLPPSMQAKADESGEAS